MHLVQILQNHLGLEVTAAGQIVNLSWYCEANLLFWATQLLTTITIQYAASVVTSVH
jgi:hypothetical protein